jgi:diguanylate cyclase (GGDEF)-like protein
VLGRAPGLAGLGPNQGGALGPSELLDLSVSHGLLMQLDHAWRRLAVEYVARHHANDSTVFFLNVDTRIVEDPNFAPGFTRALLDLHRLPPERFVLELTERDTQLAEARVERLLPHYTGQGFRIALDDVGAGYASLTALVRLRPQLLKLDKSIVTGLSSDPVRQNLVRALADFGQRSGMHVIAEGVEEVADLGAVLRAGVTLAQGWLLGRPAPYATPLSFEVRELLQRSARELRARRFQTMRTREIGALAVEHPPIAPTLTGAAVEERFRSEPQTTGLAVVDEQRRVLGLVMRNRFQEQTSGRYGYALRAGRPCADMMDRAALKVDSQTPLDTVSRLATSRSTLAMYDHVIVEREGYYHGVVSVRALLEAATELEIQHASYASPLTGLPGNVVIEQRITQQLDAAQPLAAYVYADIDNFKAYNDVYGFAAGDEVIRLVATILTEVFAGAQFGEPFVGHVGGDDFVVVTSAGDVDRACVEVGRQFDERIRQHYAPADLERGGIVTTDRRGQVAEFPICALSIAVVSAVDLSTRDVREVGRVAAELKHRAKVEARHRTGSGFVRERRFAAPYAVPG